MSQQRSNAMLGVQDMITPGGSEIYRVPSGYERYWADGLGDVYAGDWTVNPDFQWIPLTQTGR